MRERRTKIVRLNEKDISEFINCIIAEEGDLVRVMTHRGSLPPDAVVVGMYPDARANSIDVFMWHESFDIVPVGGQSPYLIGGINGIYTSVVLQKGQVEVLHKVEYLRSKMAQIAEKCKTAITSLELERLDTSDTGTVIDDAEKALASICDIATKSSTAAPEDTTDA